MCFIIELILTFLFGSNYRIQTDVLQKCTFFILAQASLTHRKTAMGTTDFKVLSYLAVCGVENSLQNHMYSMSLF